MEVVGVSTDGSAFLLSVGSDEVRVFDRPSGQLLAPVSLASAAARGPWEPFRGDVERVLRLVELSEHLG
jgi:hypothetical protein